MFNHRYFIHWALNPPMILNWRTGDITYWIMNPKAVIKIWVDDASNG